MNVERRIHSVAGKELLYVMIHSAKDKARHTVSATNQDAPLAIRRRKLLYSPGKSLFEVRPSITVMHSLDDEQPTTKAQCRDIKIAPSAIRGARVRTGGYYFHTTTY